MPWKIDQKRLEQSHDLILLFPSSFDMEFCTLLIVLIKIYWKLVFTSSLSPLKVVQEHWTSTGRLLSSLNTIHECWTSIRRSLLPLKEIHECWISIGRYLMHLKEIHICWTSTWRSLSSSWITRLGYMLEHHLIWMHCLRDSNKGLIR